MTKKNIKSLMVAFAAWVWIAYTLFNPVEWKLFFGVLALIGSSYVLFVWDNGR